MVLRGHVRISGNVFFAHLQLCRSQYRASPASHVSVSFAINQRRCLVWIFSGIIFIQPVRVNAWEDDIHYGLTKWLAFRAGFCGSVAEQLGFLAVAPDDDDRDAVALTKKE